MSIDQAIADILAASSSADLLGCEVEVNGSPLVCVRRRLTTEEASAFAGGRYESEGLIMEGVRLTVDQAQLGYTPPLQSTMVIDGPEYTVRRVERRGRLLRITATRYLG